MSETFGKTPKGKAGDGLAFKDKFEATAGPPLVPVPPHLLPAPATQVMAAPVPPEPEEADEFVVRQARTVTIAQHLELGMQTTERRMRNANARTQRLADKRMEHWLNLTDAVANVVGDELMQKCTLPQPDSKFTFDTETVMLTFRPFNRSTFDCVFTCSLRKLADEGREYETPWSLLKGTGHKPFTVHQDWRPSSDGTSPADETRVYTVAEAVHLTYLQGDGYDDALKRSVEMKRRDAEEVSAR